MNKQTQDVLNKYLAAALGNDFELPEFRELSRQREAFLARFGPEQLEKMSRSELLRDVPLNLSNPQPMDYWLEFKNDHDFSHRLFGSIAGGSSAKYGAWQDKKTGAWRVKATGSLGMKDITEAEAYDVVNMRRIEILDAVAVLKGYAEMAIEDVDPRLLQSEIDIAAPRWKNSAWFHKYLHICFPGLVTWTSTDEYSMAELYRVGVVPDIAGNFARDCRVIRFWNNIPALEGLPIELKYRCGRGLAPRDHWCLGLAGNATASDDMVAGGHLSLGPAAVGDLQEVFKLSKKKEIQLGVKAAFQDAGLNADSPDADNLTELAYRLKEGSVIALFSDERTVVAVGQVSGDYGFVAGADRPHQVSVLWHHQQSFNTAFPLETGARLMMLKPIDPAAAEIEASLVLNGVGPWKNFGKVVGVSPMVLPERATVGDSTQRNQGFVQLPPLKGIARHVVDMLERKRQVILYGPPGTGKTYHAEQIALEVVARNNFKCLPIQLSRTQREAVFGRGNDDAYITTCTFHPMYSYEDFIEGYRPDGNGFKLEPGIFKRMVTAALAQPEKRFVLVIDEINRGNIPKIFGELITLVEASKRGTTSSILPLSKELFTVPRNLWVIGTMNTADRSILLLDTALRRRFAFKELLPEPHHLREGRIGEVTLSTWLRALNRRIANELGRDGRNLQVGHAYFMPGGKAAATIGRISEIVRDELWPLLQEYCYEDPRKLSNILAGDKGGVFDPKTANLRDELFEPGLEEELIQALLAIVTPDDIGQEAAIEEDTSDEEGNDEQPNDEEETS